VADLADGAAGVSGEDEVVGRTVGVAAGGLDGLRPLVVVRLGGAAAVEAVVVGGGGRARAAVESAARGVGGAALVAVGQRISVGSSGDLAVGPLAGILRTAERY
jgi:hypothetical protein